MEQKWANKLNIEEFNLISTTAFPLLKKSAMDKVRLQLQQLGEELQTAFPPHSYKISTGENHQWLPWMVLDFPKIAHAQFPFLLRTFFWWGKGIQYQVFVRKDVCKLTADSWLMQWHDSDYLLLSDALWDNDLAGPHYEGAGSVRTEKKNAINEQEVWKGVRHLDIKKPEDLFPEAFGFYSEWMAVLLAAQQSS